MKKEKSCGIIVFNNEKVLVIKHNQGHYGFPKGHVEDNESEHETAIREVKEETNIDAIIVGDFRNVITYIPKENVTKDVIYFVGYAKSFDLKNQESEISGVDFYNIYDVIDIITYDNEKILYKKALSYYEQNRSLFK